MLLFYFVFAVSIPHRYGKNLPLQIDLAMPNSLFPFLIGTVRTEPIFEAMPWGEKVFPFLIGTVRTKQEWGVF